MPIKVVSSKPYTLSEYYRRLLKYGYLVKVLAQRELKVKYSRTLLGLGWFFLQPLMVVLVYSLFFKYLVHIHSDNIPYPSFVFSGLVLWYLFTGIVGKATYSLIESGDLINKVPFPRLIILVAKVLPAVLECLVLLLLLFLVRFVGGESLLRINTFTAFFYFMLVLIFSLAVGVLCSVFAVKYRDVAHMVPMVMNFAIWVTPVFFPISIIPAPYGAYLRFLNPLAYAIEGFRSTIFFNASVPVGALAVFVFSCGLLLLTCYYFVKFEKNIVESL